MGIPDLMKTGRSAMDTAKAAIATSGHNISNANTPGYTRQRTVQTTQDPQPHGQHSVLGRGVELKRVERINDEYLNKQINDANRQTSNLEEKESLLQQVEDIFNEMNGDGLNRIMAKFFNTFRQLANDPDSEAVRQAVRESSQALANDFHRIRNELMESTRHIDSRIEGYVREMNSLANEVKGLNLKIAAVEISGASPNDLLDQRDEALKKLSSYIDVRSHKDEKGYYYVEMQGIGPLVTGPKAEQFSVVRSPMDDQGKPENALDILSTSAANSIVTHQIKGGKLGALLEVRDKTIDTALQRLDDLAYKLTTSVNQIHRQGLSRKGVQGIDFFKSLDGAERAAQYFGLSDAVTANVNNIATAIVPQAPGDNRVAVAISELQGHKLMGSGTTTMDDWYNSIVSDVGVISARNRSALNQQKGIMTQMDKLRDQLSGVSIDEETANLLQYQQIFDASAKVIKVADEMLETVLNMKKD